MPPQGRLLDTAKQATHDHCCGVPHTVIGPAILGSDNVFVNKLPALRKGDATKHCGSFSGQLTVGSNNVTTGG